MCIRDSPDVGAPIDKLPTCSVPGIEVPGLYAKGLAVAIYIFIYKYTDKKKRRYRRTSQFSPSRKYNVSFWIGLIT